MLAQARRELDVVGQRRPQGRVAGRQGRVDRLRGVGEGREEGRGGEDVG